MHELSIAQCILDIVNSSVPEEQAANVSSIHIRLGSLSGVVADSLEFCFNVLVADTSLRRARLSIEAVNATSECGACSSRFSSDVPVFLCPVCGGTKLSLVSGTELEVSEIELLDNPGEET